MISYYELLGVSRSATLDEIKCAFKRKALETHPDKGGSQNDFLRLHNIYETLINPATRQKYDIWLKDREKIDHHTLNRTTGPAQRNTSEAPKLYLQLIQELITILESFPVSDNLLGNLILHLAKSSDKYYSDIKPSDTPDVSAAKVIYSITTMLLRESKYPKMENVMFLHNYCLRIIDNHKTGKEEQPSNNETKRLSHTGLYFIFLVLCLGVIAILVGTVDDIWNRTSSYCGNDIVGTVDDIKDKSHSYCDSITESSESIKRDPVVGEDYIDGRVFLPSDSIELNLKRNSKSTSYNKNNNYPSYKYTVTHFKNGDSPYALYFGKGRFDYESLSKLEIINYSTTNAVVLLIAETGAVLRNVYVGKDSKYTLRNIPSSSCIIRVMLGNDWNEEKYNGKDNPSGGFMRDVSITESKWNNSFDFYPKYSDDSIEYPTYSVTLHKVRNGNFGSHRISINDFFEK